MLYILGGSVVGLLLSVWSFDFVLKWELHAWLPAMLYFSGVTILGGIIGYSLIGAL